MSEFKYTIQGMETDAKLSEYVRECVNMPKFLTFCEQCTNYGKTWSSPPFDFDPMEIWNKYEDIRFFARKIIPSEPNQDIHEAMTAFMAEKDRYLELMLYLEAETEGSLALFAGACNICDSCAKSEGLPCRQPDKMRHSIESLGGDVGLTCEKYFGEPLLWIKNNELPEHLMLIGALLLPERGKDLNEIL